jgi:hypothetical protein
MISDEADNNEKDDQEEQSEAGERIRYISSDQAIECCKECPENQERSPGWDQHDEARHACLREGFDHHDISLRKAR